MTEVATVIDRPIFTDEELVGVCRLLDVNPKQPPDEQAIAKHLAYNYWWNERYDSGGDYLAALPGGPDLYEKAQLVVEALKREVVASF